MLPLIEFDMTRKNEKLNDQETNENDWFEFFETSDKMKRNSFFVPLLLGTW